jgi:transcriptional regulator with XRE-family HTH domain
MSVYGDPLSTQEVQRLVAGEHPLTVFREHRRMSIADLAAISGVPAATIAAIETGEEFGSADLIARLAQSLHAREADLAPSD